MTCSDRVRETGGISPGGHPLIVELLRVLMPHHGHSHEEPEAGQVYRSVDEAVDARSGWARREGIPTDKQLLVVACMNERIPVEGALGIELGDAQVFRNAGGRVTDDIDVACARQVELLEGHPLIPEETAVHGCVYEVESGHLRRPGERVAEMAHARRGVAGIPAGDPLVRPAACSARPGRRARRCRGRRQPRRCRRRASDSPRPRRAPGCS